LSATPFGILRPEANVMTCVAFASRKRTAYTRSARVRRRARCPCQCERARLWNAVGEDADLEAGRKLDELERQALGVRRLRERERDARESRPQGAAGSFSSPLALSISHHEKS